MEEAYGATVGQEASAADPWLEAGPSGRAAGPQTEGRGHALNPDLHEGANPDDVSELAHAELRLATLKLTIAAQVHAAHLIGQVLRRGRGLMGHAAVGRLSVGSRSRRWSRVAAQEKRQRPGESSSNLD